MKTFSIKGKGEFSATLVDSVNPTAKNTKQLSIHTPTAHFHFPVPKTLCAKAGRVFKRPDGEAVLRFAEDMIDIETGFKSPSATMRRRKALVTKGRGKTLANAFS